MCLAVPKGNQGAGNITRRWHPICWRCDTKEFSFAVDRLRVNGSFRMYGMKMALDPGNPSIVCVGTPLYDQ